MNIESYELLYAILFTRANDESRSRNERQAYQSALDMLKYAEVDKIAELQQFDY